ncbi:UNKNOWN [Stylonychia lemnae]|uniref:VASt domain-containing protein n=1 Tax=Stylonychia lemnae TaxID=5949 RepID=A0A078AJA6_STYLE|nr:UNKNOWN [Stylonychia lemnae]|eukprot:CDW81981.1 UNKNOWN [Stylonychia lemnae]
MLAQTDDISQFELKFIDSSNGNNIKSYNFCNVRDQQDIIMNLQGLIKLKAITESTNQVKCLQIDKELVKRLISEDFNIRKRARQRSINAIRSSNRLELSSRISNGNPLSNQAKNKCFSTEINPQNQFQTSDEDLKAQFELKYKRVLQDYIRLETLILPINVTQIFDIIFSDNATYSFKSHFEAIKSKDVTIDPNWDTKNDTSTSKMKLPSKMIKQIIPVSGVPFLSETRHEKLLRLVTKCENEFIIDIENRSLDVPFSDCFIVHERWIAFQDQTQTDRSTLAITLKLEFLKSTMFKGKITARTEEGVKQSYKQWVDLCQRGGYFDKQVIPQNQQQSEIRSKLKIMKNHGRSKSMQISIRKEQIQQTKNFTQKESLNINEIEKIQSNSPNEQNDTDSPNQIKQLEDYHTSTETYSCNKSQNTFSPLDTARLLSRNYALNMVAFDHYRFFMPLANRQ